MRERRRYERMAFFCPVHLSVLPDGPVVTVHSFDISVGGIGLAAALSIERGTDVRLRFQLNNDSSDVVEEEVSGRVAYTRADEDGNRIGVEFLEIIKETTHPALIKKLNSL